jgi:CRISPR-associated protein Cmr4
MTSKILTLFTRTPLHVGAGASVGAIDQPIVRERHTGFPIIPGSSLKGVLADLWHADTNTDAKGKTTRDLAKNITWLFGSDSDEKASAGALSFGEARLLLFPIRSAKGSFAWITSPLLLARASRDSAKNVSALSKELSDKFNAKDGDSFALFAASAPIALAGIAAISATTNTVAKSGTPTRLVLEDYTFTHAAELPAGLADALKSLIPDTTEPVLADLANRLVIISDGMMSFFAKTACEIAQHVRIDDATGTASEGGLFNQENVPAETLFYAVIHATPPRSATHRDAKKSPADALASLAIRLDDVRHTLQIGGDATTGLGYCTAILAK